MSKLAEKCQKCNFARYWAELVATLVFVFIGAGSVIAASYFGDFNGVAIAAAHGFTIFVMVAATGKVSGGHINPIVTWAAMLRAAFHGNGNDDMGFCKLFLYIPAQLAGAAAGGGILYGLAYFLDGGKVAAEAVNYGTPGLASGLEVLGGFFFEMIFGFILAFVILRTAMEDRHPWAPLAIGMTVFVLALMGGSFTGAAMNPARWFGPALVSGTWDNWWVYAFAPVVGAMIAVIVNDLISRKSSKT